MKHWFVFFVSFILVLLTGQNGSTVERSFTEKFCITPPHDFLCSQQPFDQVDFSSDFNYMLIEKGAQDPFDVFSWQAFVALNWPARPSGVPLESRIGSAPEAPRAWQSFARRDELFSPDEAKQRCGNEVTDTGLLISDLVQSDGTVLVDHNRNFTVYATLANSAVTNYIRSNALNTTDGQISFTTNDAIAFPQGHLHDPAGGTTAVLPATTLKMAWRILEPEDIETHRFFARDAVIHVPAARSLDTKPRCISAKLGLVGMHIATRTASGNGDEWIWSTFEHVDNAPTAINARSVNSIYADELFPEGCKAATTGTRTPYSYFDPHCKNCQTNNPLPVDWRWSDTAPYARLANGKPAERTQAVRCWKIFESTATVNRLWSKKLKGTVWANYMLISTQWRATDKSPLFEHGEIPRYLTNITLETFQQTARDGTCLGCHAGARTSNGQSADFVFMLQRARKRSMP